MGVAGIKADWKDGALEILRVDTGSLVARISSSGIVMEEPGPGKTYYVDPASGSDSKDGRDPDRAVQTFDALVGGSTPVLKDYDRIKWWGKCQEEVTTPLGIDYVEVSGLAVSPRGNLMKADAAAPCFTVRGFGWRFRDFKAEAHPDSTVFKFTRQTVASAHDASDFQVVRVEGNNGGRFIELDGAPGNWWIVGCPIHDFSDTAIFCENPDAVANPYRGRIIGNQLFNNANHIVLPGNMLLIEDNDINDVGPTINATKLIDLRGGTLGRNIVTKNRLFGTYNEGGGYFAGSNDLWRNNDGESGRLDANPTA